MNEKAFPDYGYFLRGTLRLHDSGHERRVPHSPTPHFRKPFLVLHKAFFQRLTLTKPSLLKECCIDHLWRSDDHKVYGVSVCNCDGSYVDCLTAHGNTGRQMQELVQKPPPQTHRAADIRSDCHLIYIFILLLPTVVSIELYLLRVASRERGLFSTATTCL